MAVPRGAMVALALAACVLTPTSTYAEDAQQAAQKNTPKASQQSATQAKHEPASAGEAVKAEPAAPLPRCAIQVELLAVVLEDKKDDRSFAMVADKGKKPRMVGVGSWIGDRTVRAIEPRAIWLSDPAGLCWLPLERGAAARPATPPPTAQPGNPDDAEERRKQREERRAERRKARPSVNEASNE